VFNEILSTYCKAAESAMQFQQEMLRQWSSQWPTATVANGNRMTEQVRTMQKKASEGTTEVMNKQRESLDALSKTGIRAIEDASGIAKAAIIPRRHGDGDADATAFQTGEGATIQLREEELQAHKRLVETGEVRVRKDVVTEHRMIEVPVQREEMVIERHAAPTGAHASATDIGPGEEIRIALREERVTVEKRPVVKEEVTVGKRVVHNTERVGGEVRKEEMRVVRVEREGEVNAHTAASWGAITAGGEESEIRYRAYLKWLEEGCPEGQDRRHYFEAIKQVRE
jgi:uncharacterized protein (TIGR02271 family)